MTDRLEKGKEKRMLFFFLSFLERKGGEFPGLKRKEGGEGEGTGEIRVGDVRPFVWWRKRKGFFKKGGGGPVREGGDMVIGKKKTACRVLVSKEKNYFAEKRGAAVEGEGGGCSFGGDVGEKSILRRTVPPGRMSNRGEKKGELVGTKRAGNRDHLKFFGGGTVATKK